MKGAILALAAAAMALLLGTTGAGASQSLSDFLENCKTDVNQCRATVNDIILAAKSSRYACIPHNLPIDEAVDRQLEWLKDAAQRNPRFGNEDMEDALWAGVSDLWPCPKKV